MLSHEMYGACSQKEKKKSVSNSVIAKWLREYTITKQRFCYRIGKIVPTSISYQSVCLCPGDQQDNCICRNAGRAGKVYNYRMFKISNSYVSRSCMGLTYIFSGCMSLG